MQSVSSKQELKQYGKKHNHRSFFLFIKSATVTAVVLIISLIFIFGFWLADYNTAKTAGKSSSIKISEINDGSVKIDVFGKGIDVDIKDIEESANDIRKYDFLLPADMRIAYIASDNVFEQFENYFKISK